MANALPPFPSILYHFIKLTKFTNERAGSHVIRPPGYGVVDLQDFPADTPTWARVQSLSNTQVEDGERLVYS